MGRAAPAAHGDGRGDRVAAPARPRSPPRAPSRDPHPRPQEARKIPKVSLGEGAPPPRAPAAPRPDDAAPADGLWDVLDPDWARAQVRDFGELRAALAEAAAAGGPGPSPGAALDVGGRRRAREVAAEIVRGRGPAAGGAPPLSLVRGLDRVGAAYLIQELAGAVRGAPWARGPAEWLYGLLSHVEEPLDPETCAAVYSLSGEAGPGREAPARPGARARVPPPPPRPPGPSAPRVPPPAPQSTARGSSGRGRGGRRPRRRCSWRSRGGSSGSRSGCSR